jgi:MoxR-like ATPase
VIDQVRRAAARAVTGQPELIEQLLISVVCGAHSQLEGPAGVGKWLAVESLSRCLGLEVRKLRCSPDLTTDDLIASLLAAGQSGESVPESGEPRFANIVCVDDDTQLPPRLRGLIQQAIQERVVDWRSQRWPLPEPFSLFATRYPREEEVGDTISDVHDDRFLFRIVVDFPPYHEEFELARSPAQSPQPAVPQVLSSREVCELQRRVCAVESPPPVVHYAVRLVRATRVHEGENPDFVFEWVQQGAGPRAVHGLVLAARARALLDGRSAATHADVHSVIGPVLRHRIITNRNARSSGITADRVIERLLDEIPPRVVGDDVPPRPGQAFTLHDWTPVAE